MFLLVISFFQIGPIDTLSIKNTCDIFISDFIRFSIEWQLDKLHNKYVCVLVPVLYWSGEKMIPPLNWVECNNWETRSCTTSSSCRSSDDPRRVQKLFSFLQYYFSSNCITATIRKKNKNVNCLFFRSASSSTSFWNDESWHLCVSKERLFFFLHLKVTKHLTRCSS